MGKARSITVSICIHICALSLDVEKALSATSNLRMTTCYIVFFDIGQLGYGRYVFSARPQSHFVSNAAHEIYSAHPTSGGPYY
jgi:hypothetical protein